MISRLFKYCTFIGVVSILLASCIKDDVEDLGDKGNTFIKVKEAPNNKIFFSPFTDVKKVDLFSLRKDANSSAELNSGTPVTLTRTDSLIDNYNDENGTNFEPLPDSLYTIDSPIPVSGDNYDMSFADGEFARTFTISLDGSKWNLEHTYALGFTITNVGDDKISADKKTILALLSVKNKWDGVYTVSGSFSDVTNAAFVGVYPYEWELQTTGPTQCLVVDNVLLGGAGFVFDTGAGLSYYGSFGLLVNFDPETNTVTSVTNYYGQPAGNSRYAELDPTGINAYDEATKTVNIKYFMKQPSVVTAAPYIRCMFDEAWKYKGPRE